MKVFFQITADRGTLSGYFGPDDLIQHALSVFTSTVLQLKRGYKVCIPHGDSGFQAADTLVNSMHPGRIPKQSRPVHPIRHVRLPSSPARDFAPVGSITMICGKKFDMNAFDPFSGITIIESEVLITVSQEEEPEMIGMVLRNLAFGTGGIVVIGKEWKRPVMDLEPWFDRIGLICEQPPERRGKRINPDYCQTLIY